MICLAQTVNFCIFICVRIALPGCPNHVLQEKAICQRGLVTISVALIAAGDFPWLSSSKHFRGTKYLIPTGGVVDMNFIVGFSLYISLYKVQIMCIYSTRCRSSAVIVSPKSSQLTSHSPWSAPSHISTSTGILWIRNLGTNVSEIIIEIHIFSFKNVFRNAVCEMAAILSRPQCSSSPITAVPWAISFLLDSLITAPDYVWMCSIEMKETIPDSNFHGAHLGYTWILSAPGGPHVGNMHLDLRGWTPRNPVIRWPKACYEAWYEVFGRLRQFFLKRWCRWGCCYSIGRPEHHGVVWPHGVDFPR